jgi:hypothetical protein
MLMANVVDLAAGVKVNNAAGEEVEFTGGTVTMKQLVSKFEIIDGLTWEDGTPVSSADLELGKKIACDPESGATSFITCDKTASAEFLAMALVTPRLGFLAFKTRYTSSPFGRSTPLISWVMFPPRIGRPIRSLPRPRFPMVRISLVEWVKGEKMVFAANEHWPGGADQDPEHRHPDHYRRIAGSSAAWR